MILFFCLDTLNVQKQADLVFNAQNGCSFSSSRFISTSLTMMMRLMRSALFVLAFTATVQGECDPDNCKHGDCYHGTCLCEPNYSGDDCSIPFEICGDGEHTCFNGSTCVPSEHPDEGTEKYTYHCDCTKAIGTSAYAGLQCKQHATSYCILGRTESRYSFCTNGGTCIAQIVDGERHPGCKCPDEFEGQHCQYLIGFAPEEELGQPHLTVGGASGGASGGAGGIVVFIIVIVAVGALMAVGYVVYLKKRRGAANRSNEPVGPLGRASNALTTIDLTAMEDQEVI